MHLHSYLPSLHWRGARGEDLIGAWRACGPHQGSCGLALMAPATEHESQMHRRSQGDVQGAQGPPGCEEGQAGLLEE